MPVLDNKPGKGEKPNGEMIIGKRATEEPKDRKPEIEILIGKRADEEPKDQKPKEEKNTTKRICSWCKKVLGEKEEVMTSGSGETHGMCYECAAKKQEEIEDDNRKRGIVKVEKVRYCSKCEAKIGRKIICGVCYAKNE